MCGNLRFGYEHRKDYALLLFKCRLRKPSVGFSAPADTL